MTDCAIWSLKKFFFSSSALLRIPVRTSSTLLVWATCRSTAMATYKPPPFRKASSLPTMCSWTISQQPSPTNGKVPRPTNRIWSCLEGPRFYGCGIYPKTMSRPEIADGSGAAELQLHLHPRFLRRPHMYLGAHIRVSSRPNPPWNRRI